MKTLKSSKIKGCFFLFKLPTQKRSNQTFFWLSKGSPPRLSSKLLKKNKISPHLGFDLEIMKGHQELTYPTFKRENHATSTNTKPWNKSESSQLSPKIVTNELFREEILTVTTNP